MRRLVPRVLARHQPGADAFDHLIDAHGRRTEGPPAERTVVEHGHIRFRSLELHVFAEQFAELQRHISHRNLRARQVQKRAARVGFEWEHPQEAVEKAREEVEEFLQARSEADPDRLAEELGDVLFALVNVARYYGICSEDALRKTIDKFHVRFRFIESELRKQGREPLTATPEEMDQLWEEAKGLDPQQGDPS